MRNYYRVRLGRDSANAAECFSGNFIGTDYEIEEDLSGRFHDKWKDFNREFIPIYQKIRPDKTKIGAGLAMGALWTVSKGILDGDIVLCPDGKGSIRIGQVAGGYYYQHGAELQHRRPVIWLGVPIPIASLSEGLRASVITQGTVIFLNKHSTELDAVLKTVSSLPSPLPDIAVPEEMELAEDPVAFAMESHLEEFLVANWAQTELGREFVIFAEDGEQVGQQYQTDTGPLDILAISKDKKRLLVVELKRGRASDAVVGQLCRYMGYVKEELAEPGQTVEGVIVALEDDQRIRRAISIVPNIRMYRYEVSFKLVKA